MISSLYFISVLFCLNWLIACLDSYYYARLTTLALIERTQVAYTGSSLVIYAHYKIKKLKKGIPLTDRDLAVYYEGATMRIIQQDLQLFRLEITIPKKNGELCYFTFYHRNQSVGVS